MGEFGGLKFQILDYKVFSTHLSKMIQGEGEDNVWS
jgi:hypothetical protein